jgi:hypothetical protein
MTSTREIEYFSHMDWLTKSYGYAKHPGEILPTSLKSFYVEGDCTPFSFYDRAYLLRCGGTFHMSRDKAQGCRLDLSGVPLAYIRENTGMTCEGLCQLLASNPLHKRTTRMDYCFNARGDGDINQLYNWCDSGAYKGRLKLNKAHKIPGSWDGITVPFGSPKSDFFVRAYDKGAEMKNLSLAWARVEAQFRGDYAQNAVSDAIGGMPLAVHARTKISQSIGEVPIAWWQNALAGDNGDITKIARKETKWLNRMNQLLEEIMKKVNDNPEILDYVEEEWLPNLAEKIMQARIRQENKAYGDNQDVPYPTETYTINDDWTITKKVD